MIILLTIILLNTVRENCIDYYPSLFLATYDPEIVDRARSAAALLDQRRYIIPFDNGRRHSGVWKSRIFNGQSIYFTKNKKKKKNLTQSRRRRCGPAIHHVLQVKRQMARAVTCRGGGGRF